MTAVGRAGALLVGALLVAGCSAPGRPAPAPDACALVAAKTVADIVGPTLSRASTFGFDAAGSICGWSMHADTRAEDTVIRNATRELSVTALRSSGDPCSTLDDIASGGPEDRTVTGVDGLGLRSVLVQRSAVSVPDAVKYCRADGTVTVSFLGVDTTVGAFAKLPPERIRETLLRVAGEVEQRWAGAPPTPPKVTGTPAPPAAVDDPCALVSAATAADLGLTTAPRPLGEAPDESDRKGRDCLWLAPGTSARLVVTVVEFSGIAGRPAAAWADLHVEQWAAAWAARPLPGLGDRAAVANDRWLAKTLVARGPTVITVEYRSGPPAPDALPADVLAAGADRVAREAVAALPG